MMEINSLRRPYTVDVFLPSPEDGNILFPNVVFRLLKFVTTVNVRKSSDSEFFTIIKPNISENIASRGRIT
jgi:hypothetical protein